MQVHKLRKGYKLVKWYFKIKLEIPEDWECLPFRDGIEFLTDYEANGSYELLRNNAKVGIGKPYAWFVRSIDLENERYGFTAGNQFCSEETYDFLKKSKLLGGELLVMKVGAGVGNVYIMPKLNIPATVGNNLFLVHTNNLLLNIYAYYWFKSEFGKNTLITAANSGSYASLNKDSTKNCLILFPPINEQKKIASILSNVDSLIQQTQKEIDQTQRLKKGLMQKLLTKGIGHTKFKQSLFGKIPIGWEIIKLKDVTTKIGSGVTPSGGSEVYLTKGIPFIRSQNVHFDGLRLEDVAHISEKIHDEMKNTKLQPFDVLLNITGASIGRCTYVPINFGEGNVNQHVCIIRTTKDLDPIFLKTFLSTEKMQQVINSAQVGLSRQGLTFKEIANFSIVFPPHEEQKEIVSIFSNIDSKIQHEQEYKSKLETLKKGLMQKLLTGQIRVNV